MVKVKICGITNLEDALFTSARGADAVGFIFSKRSPRYITKQKAKKIISKLDPFLVKVGVFVNEEKQKVLDIASYLSLDVLQFHGDESPAYCSYFRRKFKVIKVFFPEDRPFDKKVIRYNVDAFLFDVRYEEKIKGVKTLPRDVLKEIAAFIKSGKRIIISGGLNTGNIVELKKYKPYAVDVASGVEEFVGKKDHKLVDDFIRKVKS